MKKLIGTFFTILISILFIACEGNTTSIPTTLNPTSLDATITPITEVTTTQAPTIQPSTTIDQETSRDNVKEKITFYKIKLLELSGLEEEMIESELGFNQPSIMRQLSLSEGEYYREDLPEQSPREYPGNGIDPEFLFITTDTLNQFLWVLTLCDNFQEDVFMEVQYESQTYIIKTSVKGDQLYIESYSYYTNQPEYSISTNIMFFDLIEGKVIFKYVRDYNSSDHYLYYDEFSETGNIISIGLNKEENIFSSIQIYNRETNMTFSLSNTVMGGIYMGYNNVDGSKFIGINIDESGNIIRHSIRYGSLTDFWYINDDGIIHLTWNLYLVSGWNKCFINDSGDDRIYMDEQEVLEDFTISINIQDIYANARLTTNEEAFTETLMNLYDYGLVFNEITFAQLNADIDYIDENFLLIMAENGLSLNMTDNYDNLLVMFPFLADETIIQEILTQE
jgi:hypothetical protein